MSEHSTAQARASVMLYDNERKQWQPSGGSAGLSRVNIYHHPINNTFRIVGRKLNDHAVVINCALARGLKYNKATPTFHQWRDQRQVYGLNFQSKEDAEAFGEAVRDALETLKEAPLAETEVYPSIENPGSALAPVTVEDVKTFQSIFGLAIRDSLKKLKEVPPAVYIGLAIRDSLKKLKEVPPAAAASASYSQNYLQSASNGQGAGQEDMMAKIRQRQNTNNYNSRNNYARSRGQEARDALETVKEAPPAEDVNTSQSIPEESASKTMYKTCDLKQEPFVLVQSKSLENTISSKTVMESTSKRPPPVPKPRQRQPKPRQRQPKPKEITSKIVNTGDSQPEHGAEQKESVRDIITKMKTRIPTDIPIFTGANNLEQVTCPTSYQEICANCEELPPDVLFEPCLHIIACQECAWKMKRCSTCKTKIERKVTHDGETLKEPPMLLAHAVSMDQLNELKKELDEVKRDVECNALPRNPSTKARPVPPRPQSIPSMNALVGVKSVAKQLEGMGLTLTGPPKRNMERVTGQTSYQEICAICDVLPPDVIFEPCLHVIACQACAWKMRRCLTCKTQIERKVTHDGETLEEPKVLTQASMDRVNELEKELDEVKRDVECQICMEQRCNTLFNCGHKTCSECSEQISQCPYCKVNITERKIMY